MYLTAAGDTFLGHRQLLVVVFGDSHLVGNGLLAHALDLLHRLVALVRWFAFDFLRLNSLLNLYQPLPVFLNLILQRLQIRRGAPQLPPLKPGEAMLLHMGKQFVLQNAVGGVKLGLPALSQNRLAVFGHQ